jgi:hypothetical protein
VRLALQRTDSRYGASNLRHIIILSAAVRIEASTLVFHVGGVLRETRGECDIESGYGGVSRLLPSRTTGHTGPYPAVRWIKGQAG